MSVSGNEAVQLSLSETEEVRTGASEPANGSTDYCVPHSLISLNFDEQAQRSIFANAMALRYKYRSVGSSSTASNEGWRRNTGSEF